VIIAPRSAEYWQAFEFAHSAFRWEGLQVYEDEAVAAFLAGEPKPAMPSKERWVARVRSARELGKVMARVHGVQEPLTDYLRYELEWSYPPNVAAGEDIRISPAWSTGIRDFWLFDSRTLLWLNYNDSGHLVSAELDGDPDAIVQANFWRDHVMHAGVPLHDYMREKLAA